MAVIPLVSHPLMSWLKEEAPASNETKDVTLGKAHDEIFPLNALAFSNIFTMFVALARFQLFRS